MAFVERDHVIQHFPAYALDQSFGDAVLPRAPKPGPKGFQSAVLQESFNVGAELAVVVEHDVAIRARQRKSLPQQLTIQSLEG